MKITLLGYGKMGREIERVAGDQGHQIVHRLGREENREAEFKGPWLEPTEVLVDFSEGSAVPDNVGKAVRAGLPIVVGTTGWQGQLDQVRRIVERGDGACVYASNFSVGVQVLFHLAKRASQLFLRFSEYDPFIVEYHHRQKQDAPSGTALSLRRIAEDSYAREVPTASLRAGYIPGYHSIGFDSPFDTLELRHSARNREGFARGVLFACQWLRGRKGFYNLEEVLISEPTD